MPKFISYSDGKHYREYSYSPRRILETLSLDDGRNNTLKRGIDAQQFYALEQMPADDFIGAASAFHHAQRLDERAERAHAHAFDEPDDIDD
ncbi:MAG: hypothetical protein J0M00_06690 [Burkholderiales bacterium]|nr:hypothetical protein [Burkholderiales bacterium]